MRTRVHEYGGNSFTVVGDSLTYVSLADQALWLSSPGVEPVRLTPEPPPGVEHRYGDPAAVPGQPWLVAVREVHSDSGVEDEVVWVSLGPSPAAGVLVSGADFYASPRPSTDGSRLAWTSWDHPNMPWDGCELRVAPLLSDDALSGGLTIGDTDLVAGGSDESVGQPVWSEDRQLYFVSDRFGWWQPLVWSDGAAPRRLSDEPAEFHAPDWVLGQSTMVPLDEARLACRVRCRGRDRVFVLGIETGELEELEQPCVSISAVKAAEGGRTLFMVGAGYDEPAAVHRLSLDRARQAAETCEPVHRPASAALNSEWVSRPRSLACSGSDGLEIPMLFYEPLAPDICGPVGSPPPLVVVCHGGPTASTEAGLDLSIQAWTTRGVAVAVVDYRGSSGHGRAFRRALDGRWGVADAVDCSTAARALADMGLVDASRMAVRGSSAGGLTALRCLERGGPFAAAVVAYAVTDLRRLAVDTHNFESRYLDRLVGPWPEEAGAYEERSPALHPEAIEGAVLLLQGSEDAIVPPDQATVMAAALRDRGMRCDLEIFEGEGHGFRRSETLARSAELELSFVGSVLGFEPWLEERGRDN